MTGSNRFVRALFSSGVIVAGGKGLHFLLHVGLGRVLGSDQYGVVAFALTAVVVLSLVAGLGFQVGVVRLVPEALASRNWGVLSGVLRTSLLVVLVGSTATALIVWLIAGAAGSVKAKEGLLLTAALLVPTSFALWRRNVMRGMSEFRHALLPRDVLFPGLALVLVLLWPIGSYVQAGWVLVLATVASEGAGTYWLARAVPLQARVRAAVSRFTDWVRISTALLLAGLSRLGMDRWDILVIGFAIGMGPAGLYGASAKGALVVGLPWIAVDAVAAPRLSAIYAKRGAIASRRFAYRAMVVSLFLSIPIWAVVVVWPHVILGLFGDEFAASSDLLRLLATAQLFHSVGGAGITALGMTRYERVSAAILLSASVVSVVALVLVVPMYGSAGAAWVVLGVSFAMNVAAVIAVALSLRDGPFSRGA